MTAKKKRRKYLMRRKRMLDSDLVIDYKNPDILKRFVTERGKIIPRRISGATQAQQRCLTSAVKRARYLALLPSTSAHETERGFAGEMQAATQALAPGFRARSRASFSPDSKRDNSESSESTVEQKPSSR